jgi:chromosome segregation ATPase
MRQAADEIEKERAAVDGHIRLIEVLEDEVARLRAELAAERDKTADYGKQINWLADKVVAQEKAIEATEAERDELRAELAASQSFRRAAERACESYIEEQDKLRAERAAERDLREKSAPASWRYDYSRLRQSREAMRRERDEARAERAAERERVEKLSQENAALRCDAAGGRERVAKLREALEPLKASADRADSDDLADTDATYVVVAHLRHARAVLAETGGGDG